MSKYIEQLKKVSKKLTKPPILWWLVSGIVVVIACILIFGNTNKSYVITTEIKQAQELYSQGKLEDAKSKYESIIAKDSKNVLAINSLGNIFRDLGQPENAEEAYLEVIDIDPRFDPVYRNLLTFYQLTDDEAVKAEKLELFEPIIKRGVSLNKDSINVLDPAITYYNLMGNIKEAERLKIIMDKIKL